MHILPGQAIDSFRRPPPEPPSRGEIRAAVAVVVVVVGLVVAAAFAVAVMADTSGVLVSCGDVPKRWRITFETQESAQRFIAARLRDSHNTMYHFRGHRVGLVS